MNSTKSLSVVLDEIEADAKLHEDHCPYAHKTVPALGKALRELWDAYTDEISHYNPEVYRAKANDKSAQLAALLNQERTTS